MYIIIVFVGFAGGSPYNQIGGGSNYLCLYDDPIMVPATSSYQSHVYGVEYLYLGSSTLRNHDVGCAVCQTARKSVIMIPGTNTCRPGWVTEYTGFLAAERNHGSTYRRSEFICVDDKAEPHPHSSPNSASGGTAYLAHATTYCGSLPCLPYVHNMHLLCAVCTR